MVDTLHFQIPARTCTSAEDQRIIASAKSMCVTPTTTVQDHGVEGMNLDVKVSTLSHFHECIIIVNIVTDMTSLSWMNNTLF